MFRSMTGFGSALVKIKKGVLEIEIGSVNRKHFECSVLLPKEWLFLEISAKKEINKQIFRGQLFVRAVFYPSSESIQERLPDTKVLKALKTGWEKKAAALGYKKDKVDLSFLVSQLRFMPAFKQSKENSIDQQEFLKGLKKALKALISMKEKEGGILEQDIFKRLDKVQAKIVQIEKKAQNNVSKYAKKLKEKLAGLKFEDERILKEIALLTEKVDITEELVRLESHVKQFRSLRLEKEAVGRKMDFLLQEMGRETNTIAAKSAESCIASSVIDIKSELEKIREQVQNIE